MSLGRTNAIRLACVLALLVSVMGLTTACGGGAASGAIVGAVVGAAVGDALDDCHHYDCGCYTCDPYYYKASADGYADTW